MCAHRQAPAARCSHKIACCLLTKHGLPVHLAQHLFASPAAVAIVVDWEDSWDDPGEPFEEWLRDCVMRAVRGYCQAGKPNSLRREESVQVYRKAVNVVLENERKASSAPSLAHGICPKLLLLMLQQQIEFGPVRASCLCLRQVGAHA